MHRFRYPRPPLGGKFYVPKKIYMNISKNYLKKTHGNMILILFLCHWTLINGHLSLVFILEV